MRRQLLGGWGFLGGSDGKESVHSAGEWVQSLGHEDPRSRRPLEKGMAIPLQYSCLENPTDGGAWWDTVYGVAKSGTQLGD